MKPKRLLVAILCIAMLAGSVTALAAEKSILHEDVSGTHPYSEEGLKPVLMDNVKGMPYVSSNGSTVAMWIWNYIDMDGNIVDLNHYRFAPMFEFHEGLAAVVDPMTYRVGYINIDGKLVIPCSFGLYFDYDYNNFVGFFKNGVAPVFREVYTHEDGEAAVSSFEVGMIDKTGKLVQPYRAMSVQEAEKTITALDEYGNRWGASIEPKTTLNQSTYTTTSFEVYNPLGYFDAIASDHRVHYKLENKTTGVDQVDIVVIPCVLGGSFDYDGSMHLISDRYYPLPIAHIQATVGPGETVRDYFSPQWGWDADMLKYVVIKLDPGDMELLQENGIGGWDKDSTYHPSGRAEAENKLASDFVHKYFSDYLK